MSNTVKLTKTFIDGLEPSDRDQFYWDRNGSRFGVKVTPEGRKVFVQDYRTGRSPKWKRATIGTYAAPWTLKSAKDESLRILVMANEGVDYNAEKRAARQPKTDLAFDAYSEFFIENYLHENWKGSFSQTLSLIRGRAIPFFKKVPITELSRRDASAWVDSMKAKPATQRRAIEVVGKMFNWAVARGDMDFNPLQGVPRCKPSPKRERVLSDGELATIWKACADMRHPYGGLVQMLAVGGQRRGEVGGMLASELDRCAGFWVIPKERTKSGRENRVPVTPLMTSILMHDQRQAPLIFSISGDRPLSNHSHLKKRLDADIAKANGGVPLEHWTLHDLRRTVATGLQRLDVDPFLIEYCQGRMPLSGAALRYQHHDYGDRRRAAMMKWDAHLTAILSVDFSNTTATG